VIRSHPPHRAILPTNSTPRLAVSRCQGRRSTSADIEPGALTNTCDLTFSQTHGPILYMPFSVRSHVATTFVPPELLGAAPVWSPAYFVGPASIALRSSHRGSTIADLDGQVLEGWRVSETRGTITYDPRAAATPIYRQSNVGRLRSHTSIPAFWTEVSYSKARLPLCERFGGRANHGRSVCDRMR
jgi:hypothetical protein